MTRSRRGVVAAIVLGATLFGAASLVRQEPAAAQEREAGAQERKASAAKFEVYQDKSGGFRWRLRAQNKQILATAGESYKAKRDCLASIESVKRAAADAAVEEMPAEAAK
jgi:uncharacterized protein YegP (UPF0339 family)